MILLLLLIWPLIKIYLIKENFGFKKWAVNDARDCLIQKPTNEKPDLAPKIKNVIKYYKSVNFILSPCKLTSFK